MNFLIKKMFPFLCLGLFLIAGNNESLHEIIPMEESTPGSGTIIVNNLANALQANPSSGLDLYCVSTSFPFDLLLETNDITINSSEEFDAALLADTPNRIIDSVFPLSVSENGVASYQMDDNAILGTNFASCIPNIGWDVGEKSGEPIATFLFEGLCFELGYLVNSEDEGGHMYTGNNEQEWIDLTATMNHHTVTTFNSDQEICDFVNAYG